MAFSEIDVWRERLNLAFPAFVGRLTCFGYDWLGRAFALDSGRLDEKDAGVVMLEPGTAEVLEIPANLVSFHNSELIDYQEAALASALYHQWLNVGGEVPSRQHAVGYIKPLFLGGSDDVTNLEITDVDVYWYITAQVLKGTRT